MAPQIYNAPIVSLYWKYKQEYHCSDVLISFGGFLMSLKKVNLCFKKLGQHFPLFKVLINTVL